MSQPQRDVSIRHLNGLQLAAVAEFFWRVESLSALEQACAWAREHDQPITVLGAGSNVVAHQFVPGMVIHMAIRGIELVSDDGNEVRLRVSAGENWHEFVTWTLAQGLGGIENLALIPGTVGAAPVQNIGAYGVEVGETIKAVNVYDHSTESYRTLGHGECDFAYRESVFKTPQASSWIIVAVEFVLSRNSALALNYPELKAALVESSPSRARVYDQVVALRSKKLPDPGQTPNVGSFFKNPVVDVATAKQLAERWPAMPQYPQAEYAQAPTEHASAEAWNSDAGVKLSAAWMIDQLGWRGRSHKGIGISEKHALVVINTDGDIHALLALTEEIRATVASQFGVQLCWEPQLLGVPASSSSR